MALQLRKAKRSEAFLRLGISAPSGGGKTMGSLLLAYGLMKQKYPTLKEEDLWGKIVVVDTENKSGELFVGADANGVRIGGYNAITLEAPFTAEKYIQAMNLAEENKLEVCILDSTSHLWSGSGGLLDQQNAATKRGGNSYTAWRDITPMHNLFVERMLQANMHIIATMRSKQEYVQEKDEHSGKTTVRKIGLEPEQRKGMEYEFTVFIEIDAEHHAYGAKDRTTLIDRQTFVITPDIGKKLMRWLMSSDDSGDEIVAISQQKANPEEALQTVKEEVVQLCVELGGTKNEILMEILRQYNPKGNPNAIKDAAELSKLRSELIDLQEQIKNETN